MSLDLTMADSSSSCQKSTLESNGNPKNVENAYSDIDLLFHKNFLEEGNNFFQGEHICFTDTEEMSSSNENFDSYNLMRDNYEFGLFSVFNYAARDWPAGGLLVSIHI